jgi:hypothetical protein
MEFVFVIIDLFSQCEAVNRHIEGWSQSQTLRWLRQFGHVKLEAYDAIGVSHVFRSASGLETPFSFDDNNFIVIPGFVFHIRADRPVE